MATLGSVIGAARKTAGFSLRDVERLTGISNAHLSQIETSTITRPSMALLWSLAETLDLEYEELLVLAGHAVPVANAGERRGALGIAAHGVEELTPEEQEELTRFMNILRRRRGAQDEIGP